MRSLTLALAVLAFAAAPVVADWDVGDPSKMHYPQLPDPTGWDVDITQGFVGDDFMCMQSGLITDIHFWASWQGDLDGGIDGVWAQIWSDVPAGDDVNPLVTWSHPGEKLWENIFWADVPDSFTVRQYGMPSPQGYYNPHPAAYYMADDHMQTIQVNIDQIDNPFYQEEGTIYWLALHVVPVVPQTFCGWKTSQDKFNDDAAWELMQDWYELTDPVNGVSLDMAFVITPEPATMTLLGLGCLAMLRRRRN